MSVLFYLLPLIYTLVVQNMLYLRPLIRSYALIYILYTRIHHDTLVDKPTLGERDEKRWSI